MTGKRYTDQELHWIVALYPDYQAIVQKTGRPISGARYQAQRLGLAPTRKAWKAPMLAYVSRYYAHKSKRALLEECPGMTWQEICSMASYVRIRRTRPPYTPTGDDLADVVRKRALELDVSMPDLDKMVGEGSLFSKGNWNKRRRGALVRAVHALGGELYAEWED